MPSPPAQLPALYIHYTLVYFPTMRINCEIDETELENDEGYEIPGVVATCSKCQHSTESFGTSDASIRRCLALMREECPMCENNFYKGK